ncbi:hypothetical protein F5051DRAFT_419636 [Lentinula edodes]|nr:hypothetical protein F5051DRAFT_419636 [Lentinula edodes]
MCHSQRFPFLFKFRYLVLRLLAFILCISRSSPHNKLIGPSIFGSGSNTYHRSVMPPIRLSQGRTLFCWRVGEEE